MAKSAYKKMAKQFHGDTAGKVTGASLPESAGKGGEKSFKMGKK